MDKVEFIKMIENEEAKTLDEILGEIWDKIKPSKIGLKDYDKFRSYKRRYEDGKLGEKAINNLLMYFGYESQTFYYKKNKVDGQP